MLPILTWTLRKIGALIYVFGLAPFVIGLSPNRLRVVLYHACEADESCFVKGLNVNVTPSTFEKHLIYYKKYYNVTSIDGIDQRNIKAKSLLITFDDGYSSVHENALPMLRRYHCPAVIYLVGSAVGDQGMIWVNQLNWVLNRHEDMTRSIIADFDELRDAKSSRDIIQAAVHHLPPQKIRQLMERLNKTIEFDKNTNLFLSVDQISEMKRDGISFGFHTNEHFNLANCSRQEVDCELDSSKTQMLIDSNSFAYPFGLFGDHAIDAVSLQGYETVMTVGIGNHRCSQRHVDRVEVFAKNSAQLFAELEFVEPVLAATKSCWRFMKNWPRRFYQILGQA